MRSYKFGEADLILTLFGRKTGKISAIAKGVRKTRSRMRGGVQLFSLGDFVLYKGKSLYTVTQCEMEQPFIPVRHDLSKFAYASYCAEIMKELFPEEEANVPAFNLLVNTLTQMSNSGEELAARMFDVRMLGLSGYQPELTCCVKCTGALPPHPVFSSPDGGIVCCGGVKGIPVGKDTLALMRRLMEMDMDTLDRLRPSPKNFLEMERVLKSYWEYILEKDLMSVEFIVKMRQFA